MNPFFAALAAVAFGLTVVGADVSAAPQPSRPAPARLESDTSRSCPSPWAECRIYRQNCAGPALCRDCCNVARPISRYVPIRVGERSSANIRS